MVSIWIVGPIVCISGTIFGAATMLLARASYFGAACDIFSLRDGSFKLVGWLTILSESFEIKFDRKLNWL